MGDVDVMARRGLMLVLSGPSGAGKTSIARGLLSLESDLQLSVSATTRPCRPGERQGRDFDFVDPSTFDRMLEAQAFLEHAVVFGHRYGTPRAPVESALGRGCDMLFTIDWQGTRQLVAAAPGDVVRVFLLPPTTRELERRLRGRGRDPEDVMASRMFQALSEISHYTEYDYAVVNADLEASIARVRTILAAERQRRERLTGLDSFVDALQRGR